MEKGINEADINKARENNYAFDNNVIVVWLVELA